MITCDRWVLTREQFIVDGAETDVDALNAVESIYWTGKTQSEDITVSHAGEDKSYHREAFTPQTCVEVGEPTAQVEGAEEPETVEE